jgi:hypothetical protein
MRGMPASWHGTGESKSRVAWLEGACDLDHDAQIGVFLKLKLATCARPDLPRRVFAVHGLYFAAHGLGAVPTERTAPMPIPPRHPGGKPVTRTLIAALDESAPGADASNLRRIVDNLIGKAIDGDLSAIKEIFDRIDGKAPTAAAGTGSEEPTKVVFRWQGEE